MPEIVDLPERQTQEQIAAKHKKAIGDALTHVLPAMDAAKVDGFKVSWAVGTDYAGRACITNLVILKEF